MHAALIMSKKIQRVGLPITIAFQFITVGCADTGGKHPNPNDTGKADDGILALCQQIADGTIDVDFVGTGNVITKDNWKTIDVLVELDYDDCDGLIAQHLLSADGQSLWQFTSTDDPCDGGNTYGSIYTEDLTTPVAHIYDGDIYCEGWQPEYQAENHKCDLGAEAFAQEKMEAFGLEFKDLNSSLELRDYGFPYVFVAGVLPNNDNRKLLCASKPTWMNVRTSLPA